jgi:ABC-2 type transport system ATP-binding protein
MSSAIETADLTKRYGAITAVDRLSLHVDPGEIYGFLGLNGAGKTTTIRLLLGMVRPTSGGVSLLGASVHAGAHALWARVGYLGEAPAAYAELTVRDNLELARRLRRVSDRRAVDRAIDRLGLAPYADRLAGTLSLGNAQRLGLAKALLHEPALLVLDEPANALDPAGVVEVRALLRELSRAHGVTIFMSSHILSEVARLATRIGILHHGRLLEELDAAALDRRRGRTLIVDARDRDGAEATLRRAGFVVQRCADGGLRLTEERAADRPDAVAQLLVAAGVPPTRLALDEDDLETQFLRLVSAPGGGSA